MGYMFLTHFNRPYKAMKLTQLMLSKALCYEDIRDDESYLQEQQLLTGLFQHELNQNEEFFRFEFFFLQDKNYL